MQDNPQDNSLEPSLEKWASAPSDTELRPEIRRVVQAKLTSSLTPVRPLPSQNRLILVFLAVFTVCAVALIAIVNKAGFSSHDANSNGHDGGDSGSGRNSVRDHACVANGSRQPMGSSVFGCADALRSGPDRRNCVALSVAYIQHIRFGGLALRSFGTDNRHSVSRRFLAARAARYPVPIPWTRSNLNRVSRVPGAHTCSVPVYVSAGASSANLARRNGPSSDWARGIDRRIGTTSVQGALLRKFG